MVRAKAVRERQRDCWRTDHLRRLWRSVHLYGELAVASGDWPIPDAQIAPADITPEDYTAAVEAEDRKR
jgi:hypothetical protein